MDDCYFVIFYDKTDWNETNFSLSINKSGIRFLNNCTTATVTKGVIKQKIKFWTEFGEQTFTMKTDHIEKFPKDRTLIEDVEK